MTKKQRAAEYVAKLKVQYPDARCSLNANNALQLLIATRLSAQCTDARVNLVTPALFKAFPDAKSFAEANINDVEDLIHSCGLYKSKAKSIVEMCKILVSDYNGQVPTTFEELVNLPGIGRKTANLIMGDVYLKPAVVADTHCIRISNRLGLCSSDSPYDVEMQLKKLLDPTESNDFCHRLVLFGRDICTARNKKCDICPLFDICPSKNKEVK